MIAHLKRHYGWVALLLVILHQLYHQGYMYFAGCVYADGGINFLYNALDKSFFEQIFILDAGYLPLFQRLVAFIFLSVLPLKIWGFAINWLALLIRISLTLSLLHNVWENYIGNKQNRLILISVLLAIPMRSVTQYWFFENASLYMFLPLFTILLVLPKLKFSLTRLFIITFLFIILLPSKPYTLIMVPLFLIVGINKYLNERNNKSYFYYFAILIGAILPAFFMIKTRLEGSIWQGEDYESSNKILLLIKTFGYHISTTFPPFHLVSGKIQMVVALLFVSLIILFLIYLIKLKDYNTLSIILYLTIFVLGVVSLNTLAIGNEKYFPGRHTLAANVGILLILFVFVFKLSKLFKFNQILVGVFLILFLFYFTGLKFIETKNKNLKISFETVLPMISDINRPNFPINTPNVGQGFWWTNNEKLPLNFLKENNDFAKGWLTMNQNAKGVFGLERFKNIKKSALIIGSRRVNIKDCSIELFSGSKSVGEYKIYIKYPKFENSGLVLLPDIGFDSFIIKSNGITILSDDLYLALL